MKQAGFAFIAAGLGLLGLYLQEWLFALSALAMGGVLVAAVGRDAYIRVILAMLAGTHALLGALALAGRSGLLAEALQNYIPPLSMPIGAAGFALLIWGISYIPVIKVITRISEIYFSSSKRVSVSLPLMGPMTISEGAIGKALLASLIFINLFQVALSVRLNFFSRDLFDALAAKDASAFWFQLLWIFVPLAAIWVMAAIVEIVLQYRLRIRWREVLNRNYLGRWLGGSTHYQMQVTGQGADNPDQRISEDLRGFVDQTYQLSIGILSQAATLVSFIVILWQLSQDFTLPGTDIRVPGLLVWFAICYALVGTWLTHLIGRPLIGLNFLQEKVEADYRFSLARLREYSEQVSLLQGEGAERERLERRFGAVVGNFLDIASRQKKLTSFTASFFQASVVVPYIVAAPFYFLGKITLGQLQQTAGAFARVDGALTYFIAAYSTLANYKAVIDRLTSFEASLSKVGSGAQGLSFKHSQNGAIVLSDVALKLPHGNTIAHIESCVFTPGESVLLTGPSGCGKSTLFRAIAGIWPFASGTIEKPSSTLMILPQKPYLPISSLRAALSYPSLEQTYEDATLIEALEKARLPHLASRLDEEGFWSQILSLGEQQRLAIARALLAKPDWLFLDEATAALDEPTEEAIYQELQKSLPTTTLVSIGHRSTLLGFHQRHVRMEAQGAVFGLKDVSSNAAFA